MINIIYIIAVIPVTILMIRIVRGNWLKEVVSQSIFLRILNVVETALILFFVIYSIIVVLS